MEWDAFLLSLKVASVSMVISFPFALLCAWALARKRFFGHGLLNVLCHLPLILPPVATGYLLLLLFGRQGWIGGFLYAHFTIQFVFHWLGAALAAAIMAFPLMMRPMRVAFDMLDRAHEETARTLRAPRFTIWMSIILPLIWPGILSGLTLGFARALGEFAATITFAANIPGETQTLALALHTSLQNPDPGASLIAARLMILSLTLSISALGLSEWLSRK